MVGALLVVVFLLAGRVMGASGSTGSGSAQPKKAAGHPTTPATHPTSTGTAAASTGTPTCPDSAIKVAVAADAMSYPAAVVPGLTISVTNTGRTPCRRDVGAAALGLLITSGKDRIWSSDDCQHAQGATMRTIAPGTSVSQTVAWTRHRSSPSCSTSPAAQAQPGTYQLTGHAGSVTSNVAVFQLG